MAVNGDEVVQVDDLQILTDKLQELSNFVLYAGDECMLYEQGNSQTPTGAKTSMSFVTDAQKDEYEKVYVESTWSSTFKKSWFYYKNGSYDDGIIKCTVAEGSPNKIVVSPSKNTRYLTVSRVYLKTLRGGAILADTIRALLEGVRHDD